MWDGLAGARDRIMCGDLIRFDDIVPLLPTCEMQSDNWWS